MIQFEVIQSPDTNVKSEFKYFQNQIYLGKNTGDLWIDDNELYASHAMLEVIEKDLLIHPQRGVEFYLINGKRASNVRKLKINDQVTFGKTVIKITAFTESERQSKKELLNTKLNQLIETTSPKLSVIEKLTKRMKQ